jgi:hypothetical protein
MKRPGAISCRTIAFVIRFGVGTVDSVAVVWLCITWSDESAASDHHPAGMVGLLSPV